MRGKACRSAARRKSGGITPARAGKRSEAAPKRAVVWDHPRACGEKCANPGGTLRTRGSPPRVRGKVRKGACLSTRHRITPARAGKRSKIRSVDKHAPDHPRACGEKALIRFGWAANRGSPPRVRGKVSAAIYKLLSFGITPARAGKSGQVAFLSHAL